MAGHAPARELTAAEASPGRPAPGRLAPGRPAPGRLAIETARPGDDAAIRELLRRHPMGDAIRLALEREPSAWLAAGVEGERHHTVVARDRATGRIVGMGSRAVRRAWVDGRPVRLGYLAQLRRIPELRGRALLAEGYAACEATRRLDELPFDLTTIVADNRAARRLLERGLPELPVYRPWAELVTLTLPATRRARPLPPWIAPAAAADLPAIAACLERNLRRYQFAPAWTAADLADPVHARGLAPEDFLLARDPGDPPGQVRGCLALWDQRGFKQVVVRGYAPALGRLRPLVNLAAALAGRPRLPPPGSALALGFLSHLAVDGDDPETAVALIAAARARAAARGIELLSLGLARANPMLPAVRRRFPARELASVLYLVHRPDAAPAIGALGGRCPHVEVAVL